MSGKPAVELRHVDRAYGQVRILEQVDLQIESGEFFGLIGPNGAGKTSLLRLILGLDQPSTLTLPASG